MKRRKKSFGGIKFGEYSSSGDNILKAQWGVTVSGGIGSGRGYGSMGGGLFGGIHHNGYGNSNIGYNVYGEPVVVPYQPVNIDWKRDKVDLSDTYKLLSKMQQPVDVRKLFNIDGIDKSHLLPKDQQAFDIISQRLMNKYLAEIQRLSPNLTQEDLMKDDVNYKVNELSMRYKNAIVHLFNELKANKERVDKNKEVIGKIKQSWGSDDEVSILSSEAGRHMNVINNSSFVDYMRKYGDRWADVAMDELERSGTFGSLYRLGDVYDVQTPTLSKNIETYFVDKLTNDKISTISALNPYAFQKSDIEQLSLEKIEEIATKTLDGIMNDNNNNTEIAVTAVNILKNFGFQNKYLGMFDDANTDNLGYMAAGIKNIVQKDEFRNKINDIQEKISKGDKLSADDMSELRAITEVLNAYMLTNKKRDVKLLEKKIYIDEDKYKELSKASADIKVGKDGDRYYYIKREAYAVFDGNDATKKVYELKQRGSNNVIKIDEDEYKQLKDKESYDIISEATVPKTIQDVDIDKIYDFMNGINDIGETNSVNVAKNIAKFDVYNRMVRQGAAKLNIKQDIDVRLRDAVNVSVSQHNSGGKGGGGGELREGELPEWATLTSQLRDSVKFGNAENFMQFLRSSVLGGNNNLELANITDIGEGDHVFGVINQSIVNSTIGTDFSNFDKIRHYPFYDMENGKIANIEKLDKQDIEKTKIDFGYAFKDNNGNLVVGKLHNNLFKNDKKFSENLENIVKNTAVGDGHKHLKDAIVWAANNPDYLRVLFNIDIDKVKDEARGEKIEVVVARKIGEALNGSTMEEKRSAMSKLLFAYLGKTSNDIVIGGFMNINGKKYFVQHTSATTAVSAMVSQNETARNATFLDRYNFMKPFLNMTFSVNDGKVLKEKKEEVKDGIEKMSKEEIKNMIENLTKVSINSEEANRLVDKINKNSKLTDEEKDRLKRYFAVRLVVNSLNKMINALDDPSKEKLKQVEKNLGNIEDDDAMAKFYLGHYKGYN